MSIANEISRIQEARDTLRAKAVALGVGLSTDNITQLATKYDGIVDRGTPNAEVKDGESVTLSAGYYHGGSIKGVGGGAPSLQSKSVTYTSNGTNTITPDEGYDGLSSVDVTVDVASGGGGGGDIGGVSFIDYDGTIVETWALSDLANKTELPTPPTHDRLVFQQWNWTLEDIKTANVEMAVGALYTTASGLTEFHIRVTKTSGLAIVCNMVGNKNWGDGTEDALTSHTYTDYGDYIITCDGDEIATKVMGDTNVVQQTLLRVSIPNSVTIIRASAFSNCRTLQSISISNSVTGIGNNVFNNCFVLQSVSIPNGVTSIWDSAFNNCYSLQSVSIPNSVKSIENGAFNNCYSLQSVSIPNSVKSIGKDTFNNCYSLQSISIPNSVTSIGIGTFKGCYALQSISIPNSVTTIGDYMFNNCYALQSVSIPNSVTGIGNYAFTNCFALQSVSIPNSVTSIWASAFNNCYSLQYVSIPNSVKNIGKGAFSYCHASEYDFSKFSKVPTLSASAFKGIFSSTKILVPSALYDTWVAATNWVTYANYIVAV